MRKGRLPPVACLPVVILPALACLAAPYVPAWIFMWLLAGSIFMACKWVMWVEAIQRGGPAPLSRSVAFLFAWPGMDADIFLRRTSQADPLPKEWFWAMAKMLLGSVLFWGVARQLGGGLFTGWVGMIGLIFLLHFGSFHLLALGWRSARIPVQPLMNQPLAAQSLGDFWGRRWNVAFNEVAELLVFHPLVRKVGARWASVGAFVFSGVIHDVVISVPARGGYGLPTLYFLLQGLGLCIERSALGRKLGLRRAWRGWMFTVLVVASPAYWLFHPPFVERIVLPMMVALNAL